MEFYRSSKDSREITSVYVREAAPPTLVVAMVGGMQFSGGGGGAQNAQGTNNTITISICIYIYIQKMGKRTSIWAKTF